MAKGKLKSRTTALELFMFALVFAAAIAGAVGLFVNFITTTLSVNAIGQTTQLASETSKLFPDMSNLWSGFKGAITSLTPETIHGFEALQAFGILTLIGIAATFVMSLLKVLTDWKLMRIILVLVGIVTLACAIITVVLIYTYVPVDLGVLSEAAKFTAAPAVGGWLITIGGIAGGAGGLICAFTK